MRDKYIKAHTDWKLKLHFYVNNPQVERLDPNKVAPDCHCDLGKWIYSEGRILFADSTSFESLKHHHALFHKHAANIVDVVNSGQSARGKDMLADPNGGFSIATKNVVRCLMTLK